MERKEAETQSRAWMRRGLRDEQLCVVLSSGSGEWQRVKVIGDEGDGDEGSGARRRGDRQRAGMDSLFASSQEDDGRIDERMGSRFDTCDKGAV